MICTGCKFDLRNVNMDATWQDAPGNSRFLDLRLECPQCGMAFRSTPHQFFSVHMKPEGEIPKRSG